MDAVLLEEKRGPVLVLELNRPAAKNALAPELVQALRNSLVGAVKDKEVRAIVIAGNGPIFSGGADLGVLGQTDLERVARYVEDVAQLLVELANVGLVTIAAVEGHAIGAGADIAVACDLRIVGTGATFRFPGLSFGVVLGTRALATLVGPAVAKDIVFGQRVIGDVEAIQIGLANEVVPTGEARDRALTVATRMAAIPAEAIGMAKQLLNTVGTQDVAAAAESVRAGDFPERFRRYRDARARSSRGRSKQFDT